MEEYETHWDNSSLYAENVLSLLDCLIPNVMI